jgi:hypothetical protein
MQAVTVQLSMTTILEGLWEEVFSVGFAPRLYSEDPRQCSSVESQPVKRRLGGWCEMAASLGPS